MSVPIRLPSPSSPGAEFLLWSGWDADRRVREHLGKATEAARWPHHSCSREALLGLLRPDLQRREDFTAFVLQPGEILLAGGSVLVLQDLAEFKREAIEAVAHAWRAAEITFGCVQQPGHLRVPVRCSIMATTQACPCGLLDRGDIAHRCRCTDQSKRRWTKRIDDAVRAFCGSRAAAGEHGGGE